jgi:hypothetical protein
LNLDYTVGSGANLSVVVVDFAQTGGGSYAFGYRWNTPTDFATVLQNINGGVNESGNSLQANVVVDPNFGAFIDSINYGSEMGDPDQFWRLTIGTYSNSGVTWTDSNFGVSSVTTANFAVPPVEGDTSETAGIIGFFDSFDVDTPPTTPVTILKHGDFNFDGHVDSRDISTLLAALANASAYQNGLNSQGAALLPADISALDVNGDGQLNNADLQYLLNVLKTGGGSRNSVPEPRAWMLMLLAVACFTIYAKRAGDPGVA